jgi:hypothetical protein
LLWILNIDTGRKQRMCIDYLIWYLVLFIYLVYLNWVSRPRTLNKVHQTCSLKPSQNKNESSASYSHSHEKWRKSVRFESYISFIPTPALLAAASFWLKMTAYSYKWTFRPDLPYLHWFTPHSAPSFAPKERKVCLIWQHWRSRHYRFLVKLRQTQHYKKAGEAGMENWISWRSHLAILFELGRPARPGRQTGIRLYRPVPAKGQNKSWGHRLTAKAITYQGRHQKNK